MAGRTPKNRPRFRRRRPLRHNRFMESHSPCRAPRSRPRRRRAPWVRRATVRRLARSGRRLAGSVRRSIVALRAAPALVRVVAGAVVLLAAWAVINWAYQAIRKPTELFFPVSGALAKSPAETWRSYGPLFNQHSTAVITPALLAALAQVEGSGNPVARTYWRWSLARNPFKVYQPASSAVGMYQITDATFSEAKHYCIHDHVVVEDGPWFDASSCWFNILYSRVVPSHAIEMTSALLDRRV